MIFFPLNQFPFYYFFSENNTLINPVAQVRNLGGIFNIGYADDTTLMAESEEELKTIDGSPLWRWMFDDSESRCKLENSVPKNMEDWISIGKL